MKCEYIPANRIKYYLSRKKRKSLRENNLNISATYPDGHTEVLFTPLAPFETPEALDRICEEYNRVIGNYEALGHSQDGWHEGEEDAVPFIKYLLGTILTAYKDFEDRFEIVEEKLPAIEMVRKATQQRIGKFNKQDIRELCPALSVSSIEGSLRKLVAEGELRREGRGKSTFYVRLKKDKSLQLICNEK